jgi:UDP-N-acetylmuramate: L-alanyl-gamma-D-glutamyl-meso-diaminopimelate ligase
MKGRLYFIRIGGTAMGSVAAACRELGWEVFGSEEVLYEPMKSYLASSGVTVFDKFEPSHLDESAPDFVVVGNAVSRGNEELEHALDQRFSLISLPELVGRELIQKHSSIVVAGTHGKTTTTSMVAWVLECAGRSPGFMVGGVPRNFEVSCRPASESPGVFVTEGDEYDSAYWDKRSKFLHYRPDFAVVNNIEFDHADIFSSLEEIKKSFRLFVRMVPRRGAVVASGDDANVLEVLKAKASPAFTFGFGENCDYRAVDRSSHAFDLMVRGEARGRIELSVEGDLNQRNFLAAASVADLNGIEIGVLQRAAATYIPPKRRMEAIGEFQGATVIDDFGHHPTAIAETLRALRAKYPGRAITAVFEPRSNSTTRNIFQQELAACFEGASRVAIGALDRPQRYRQDERLNLDGLVSSLADRGVDAMALTLDQGAMSDWGSFILDWLKPRVSDGEMLVLFSNGDLGGLRQMLR